MNDDCAWTPDGRVNGATLRVNLDRGAAFRQEVVDNVAIRRTCSEFDRGRRPQSHSHAREAPPIVRHG
jgi:hypothetical protein